jgi:hypothetical protein
MPLGPGRAKRPLLLLHRPRPSIGHWKHRVAAKPRSGQKKTVRPRLMCPPTIKRGLYRDLFGQRWPQNRIRCWLPRSNLQ